MRHIYNPPQLLPETRICSYGPFSLLWSTYLSCRAAERCGNGQMPSPGALCVLCITPSARVVDATDDLILREMLRGDDAACPEAYRGVWWMRDNVVPETLITFHDGTWSSDGTVFTKTLRYNWSKDPTLAGACYQLYTVATNVADTTTQKTDHSGTLGAQSGTKNLWVYPLVEGDTLVDVSGKAVDFVPGDLLRMQFEASDLEHKRPPIYQYRLQRVAYLENGELKHTEAHKEFVRAARSVHSHVDALQIVDFAQPPTLCMHR